MSTVKCCMEQLKLLYSEDLKKLGIFCTKLWTSVIIKHFSSKVLVFIIILCYIR
jgi:hypothetical protein